MATFHIPEDEAGGNFAALMARVRQGVEVVIDSGDRPVAVLHSPAAPGRTLEECLALLPEDSPAVMDEGFARDVQLAIDTHREPLDPPAWD